MARPSYTFAVVHITKNGDMIVFNPESVEQFSSKIEAYKRLDQLRKEHPEDQYNYVVTPYERKAGGPLFPPDGKHTT